MGAIRDFMSTHYLHFNAREVVDAAKAYEAHVDAGGRMLIAMAGAMSTGEFGISLARMIRAGKVHAISCTGANLEEDVFNLLAGREYEIIPSWRDLSAQDEQALYERGMNRVTDTCIPETVMRHIEGRLVECWQRAAAAGERKLPSEFLFEVLSDPTLSEHVQRDPAHSWMLAAKEAGIPVYAPGWEDSTTGNIFAANVISGRLPDHSCVQSGTEQFQALVEWYEANHGGGETPSVGFFQIGGGIAGDFAICAVPCITQDLRREVPYWGYFCQITDAQPSYGGYSGAPANEKITWGKLEPSTPKFEINSDAAIVAPLICSWVLGD
ncbi:MAG: deoxyhypusine synthase family protein [Longimicrobiales bacterium]|nr:deoxyhypusine synthase family protein [Longimicrobiales bacterium]